MNKPSYGDRDPIAAPATPPIESALALIRVSGGGRNGNAASAIASVRDSALELLARAFSRPGKLLGSPGHSVVHGWIVSPGAGEKIDEALVSVYRAPRSYTGEDGADISCHGGIAVVKAVMAALRKAGFRNALPGEFTFRAFMNGKLDLTRAESVMELVSAKTGKGREQAARRLAGALEEEVTSVKNLLTEALAGVEIYLDYSEDEFIDPAGDEETGRLPGRNLAEEAALRLKALAGLWRRERIYAEGALAVLAGRPNAGKSSLFNYLIREDRSIVTAAPGTTRDWIEALVSVDDIPVRLADTAGLRAAGPDADEAERIGIERSLELLERADIALYVINGEEGVTAEDREFLHRRNNGLPAKLLILWNKADISAPPSSVEGDLPGRLLRVSAKTGEGIPELLRSVSGLLEALPSGDSFEGDGRNAAGPGTLRQKELIDSALASVEEALALAGAGEPLDIIAPLFRSAVNALGEITGEVSNADILEAMFSRFCVGK
jgi:tRNA modification GTPase